MSGISPQWRSLAIQALPIMACLLVVSTRRMHMADGDGWSEFAPIFGRHLLAALPLLAAHLAAHRLPLVAAAALWAVAFAFYPFVAPLIGANQFRVGEWAMLAAFSGAGLMLGRREDGSLIDLLRRLPITLDAAVLALLSVWVLALTSLFISTPDPVNNQPLAIWFDGSRIVDNPGLFLGYLLQFAIVAALTFAFYWVCRHLLVRRLLRGSGGVAFLSASIVFLALATPVLGSLIIALPLNEPHWTILPSETANPFALTNYMFALACWIVICPIVMVSERLLQERKDALLRHQEVQAELVQLRQQLNPHFLFNALNTLYALCLRDSDASARAVVMLSDLLRYSVYKGQEEWVRLDAEIAQLDNYLALQRLRFGKKCTVSAHWPDEAERYRIPPQTLLMLVENAFKHGIEPSERPSTLVIELAIEGGWMRFSCVNGPIADPVRSEPSGVGLANLRRRLELLCGEKFELESVRHGNDWHAALELELRPC